VMFTYELQGLGILKNQRRSRHKSKPMVQMRKVYISRKDNVGADEDDDPSDVMQESTFETEHAHDLSLICTPPPTSLVGNHVYPYSLDDLPSQLPRMQTTLRRTDMAESLSSLSAVSPTLHVHPACHQPTLADLHEGGGTPIPGTNQRHTIFLPHPNAPKSPPTETRGLSVHYISTTFFIPW